MYPPAHFVESRPEILLPAMRAHSFATVITAVDGVPLASHVPVVVDEGAAGAIKIRGHVARANPQWKQMEAGAPVLAIFHGPHGYVSPSWYEDGAKSVPTWNSVAVHAHGRARLLDPSELRASLNDLVAAHEGSAADRWRFDSLPAEYADKLMRAIVGFELAVERLEGKLKLSQNRSPDDRRRVRERLQGSADPMARDVARWMERLANPTVDGDARKP